MSDERADERMTRAGRVREIQQAVYPNDPPDKPNNLGFAEKLKAAAKEIGITHPSMNANRVAKMRTGAQLLQFEDVAALEAVDPAERGWFWLIFGRQRPAKKRARSITTVEQDAERDVLRPAKKSTTKLVAGVGKKGS